MIAGELRVGGRVRTYALRPPRVDGPVPLVLALHGHHPDGGLMMRRMTTFDRQAERWGWAVAYPDAVGGRWADGRGVAQSERDGVDDVAFLRALVDEVAGRHGTAADRTVVAGVSNGAFMAHRMALEAGDRVAVLAAVAGGMPAALRPVRPTHAVSVLLMHGTADRVAPIDGGYSRTRGPDGELLGRTLSLADTAEHWRTVDRCPPGAGTTRTTDGSSRHTVAGGTGGTRVAAWTLSGAGHTWPGTPPDPRWDEPVSLEFDAAEEICRFAEPVLVPAAARKL